MESRSYRYPRKIFHPKELHVKYCFHRTYAKTFSLAFRILAAGEFRRAAKRSALAGNWQRPAIPVDLSTGLSKSFFGPHTGRARQRDTTPFSSHNLDIASGRPTASTRVTRACDTNRASVLARVSVQKQDENPSASSGQAVGHQVTEAESLIFQSRGAAF